MVALSVALQKRFVTRGSHHMIITNNLLSDIEHSKVDMSDRALELYGSYPFDSDEDYKVLDAYQGIFLWFYSCR